MHVLLCSLRAAPAACALFCCTLQLKPLSLIMAAVALLQADVVTS